MTISGEKVANTKPLYESRDISCTQDKADAPSINEHGKSLEDIMLANRRSLARTLKVISAKADREHVESLVNKSVGHFEKRIAALRNEILESSSLSNVREAISGLCQRMDLLAQTVSQKVDHSYVQTLKSDLDTIHHHAQFVTNTKETLKNIQNQKEKDFARIENHDRILSEFVSQQDQIRQQLKNLSSKEELNEWKQKHTNLMAYVENALTKQKDLQIVQKQIKEYEIKAALSDELIQKLQIAHEKLATYTANRFGKVYSKEIADSKINKCLTSEKFKNCLGEFNADLDERAFHWDNSLTKMNKELESLKDDYRETKKRSMLATEFIDWYTRKGDAYEHNLNAVDGHLKQVVRNHHDGGRNSNIETSRMSMRGNNSIWST